MSKETTTKYFCDNCKEQITGSRYFFGYRLTGSEYEYTVDLCLDCYKDIVTKIAFIKEDLKFSHIVGHGYECPVCKNMNNPYTFKGECSKCGFTEGD